MWSKLAEAQLDAQLLSESIANEGSLGVIDMAFSTVTLHDIPLPGSSDIWVKERGTDGDAFAIEFNFGCASILTIDKLKKLIMSERKERGYAPAPVTHVFSQALDLLRPGDRVPLPSDGISGYADAAPYYFTLKGIFFHLCVTVRSMRA